MNDRAITPNRIWFRFLRMHQRMHSAMTARLRSIGLSVAQFDLLSTLTESDGMTQRDLAERLYVTKGNVSGLVDRLVEAGMLDRKPVPGDRRSHSLHLTPEGRRLALEGMALQTRFIEESIGQLPAQDLHALDAIMTRWRDIYRSLDAKE
jgi:DNA-binding MarR family transcriptional regulator